MKNTKAWVHLSLFLVALIYATTYTVAKLVMPVYVGAFGFILLRVAGGCALFWLIWLLFFKEPLQKKADIWRFAIAAFFGVGLNMLTFFKGLSYTTPANTGIMMLSTPVFVLIISWLSGHEKMTAIKSTGIVIALIGSGMLIVGSEFSWQSQRALGDILVLVNALSLAVFLVYVKKLLLRYHPITITTFTFSFGVLYVLPFGFAEIKNVTWTSLPPTIWIAILFVVVVATVVVYFLNMWAMSNTKPSVVGSYIYLQPILATIISISAGKEVITIEKVIFALAIFFGVYLISIQKKTT